MQIIVFAGETHPLVDVLAESVGKTATLILVETGAAFREKIRCCLDGETIIVFFVRHAGDMELIESLARDFIDMKLVIYLEDYTPLLADRAYKLRPRLVTGKLDADALLPGAVLGILAGLKDYQDKLKP